MPAPAHPPFLFGGKVSRKRLWLEKSASRSEGLLIMETHLMYDGKKYEIQGHVEHGNGSLTVDLKPVREVPPEPPRGSVYADDRGRPWWRVGNSWFSSNCTGGLRWEALLRKTSLRPMVLVPEGKSAVVFNGPFDGSKNTIQAAGYPDFGGPYYVRGYSDMEAPVHGYFEKVSDE